MKVGDLIREPVYPEDIGLIIDIRESTRGFSLLTATYVVLNQRGEVHWFDAEYIENDCEVINESR